MVNSGARELLFYEAPRGNRVNINTNEVFNVNWDTISGVLGTNLEGIWPPCTDVTDINSTCLSKNDSVIATGDDFGFVKLFEYPCKVYKL
jgi:microtubule-associated protein-like 6